MTLHARIPASSFGRSFNHAPFSQSRPSIPAAFISSSSSSTATPPPSTAPSRRPPKPKTTFLVPDTHTYSRSNTPVPTRSSEHSPTPTSSSSSGYDSDTESDSDSNSLPPNPTNELSISSLRQALDSIDCKLASLMSEREDIESRLELAVRLQSPVYRLPSELLSNIFILGVLGSSGSGAPDNSDGNGRGLSGSSGSTAGVDDEQSEVFPEENEDVVMVPVLMLVCRYWCQVALATPTLWSRILISSRQNHSLDRAKQKLIRSKSSPLYITVFFHSDESEYDLHSQSRIRGGVKGGVGNMASANSNTTMASILRAMDLILPSFWRTKSFRLIVPSRAQAHAALLKCQEETAHMLEELEIRVHNQMFSHDEHGHRHSHTTSRSYTPTPISSSSYHAPSYSQHTYANPVMQLFNSHTPNLRKCILSSFNCGWSNHMLVSGTLRVLELSGYFDKYAPDVETLLGVLKACESLEELVLKNMEDVDGCRRVVVSNGQCRVVGFLDDMDSSDTDYDLLKSSPALKNASSFAHSDVKSKPTVHLSHLLKLTFNNCGLMRTRLLLSQLHFPSLQCLRVAYLQNVNPVLERMHEQSLTRLPLRKLVVESCYFAEGRLVSLLGRLNGLKELALVDVEDVGVGLLKSLSSSQPCICPRLQSLTLDGCPVTWESLRKLVESRLPPNPTPVTLKPQKIAQRVQMPKYTSSSGFTYSASASCSASASAAAASSFSTATSSAFPQPMMTTSASASAAMGSLSVSHNRQPSSGHAGLAALERLRFLDVSRCYHISREMVQWLRMYVEDVRWGSGDGVYGGAEAYGDYGCVE